MKRSDLRRKPKPKRGYYAKTETTPAARRWRWDVTRTGCAMCRAFPVPSPLRIGRELDLGVIQGHHVIGKRHLKRERLDHLFWHVENGLGLCRYHHARHENAVQRVPRSLLPASTIAWAEEHGFGWVLDKEYG